MTGAAGRARAVRWCSLLAYCAVACTSQPAALPPTAPSPSETTAPPPTSPADGALRWDRLPSAPTKRSEVTAVASGGRILVIGGFDEEGRTVGAVEVYDTLARKWSEGPKLPVAVNHAISAQLGGTVYVLGGYLGPRSKNPSSRAFALVAGKWKELPRMPEARAAGGAAVLGGLLYVAGGVGPEGLARRMLVFDPGSGSWWTALGPPTARQHLGVAAADGRLFVVGGRIGGADSNLGAMESYDPVTQEWRELADMPTPRGGIAATATSNGLVVAPGGEGVGRTFHEAEAFDIMTGRWVRLPTMPTSRHGVGVAAVGNIVYVIDGGLVPGSSVSNVNEAIDVGPLG